MSIRQFCNLNERERNLIVPSYPIRERFVLHCKFYMVGSPIVAKLLVANIIPLVEIQGDLQILLLRWE
jgi:hypothetical protein